MEYIGEYQPLIFGDYSKASKNLDWEPKVKFDELVNIMIKEDVEIWERWKKGERFAWDAPNYPNDANMLGHSKT